MYSCNREGSELDKYTEETLDYVMSRLASKGCTHYDANCTN